MGLHFSEEEFKLRKSKVLNSMKEQNIDALLMFRQDLNFRDQTGEN